LSILLKLMQSTAHCACPERAFAILKQAPDRILRSDGKMQPIPAVAIEPAPGLPPVGGVPEAIRTVGGGQQSLAIQVQVWVANFSRLAVPEFHEVEPRRVRRCIQNPSRPVCLG